MPALHQNLLFLHLLDFSCRSRDSSVVSTPTKNRSVSGNVCFIFQLCWCIEDLLLYLLRMMHFNFKHIMVSVGMAVAVASSVSLVFVVRCPLFLSILHTPQNKIIDVRHISGGLRRGKTTFNSGLLITLAASAFTSSHSPKLGISASKAISISSTRTEAGESGALYGQSPE